MRFLSFGRLTSLVWFVSCVIVLLQSPKCEAKKSWADIAASSPSSSAATATIDTSPNNNYNSKARTTPIKPPPPKAAGSSPTAGVYPRLPDNAQAYFVRNVYDGDTLTLVDGRRVRFLGIDTPELEECQPFAVEAKQYTKDYCGHKHKEIYLSFDPKSQPEDQVDRYSRLVANVWVRLDDGKFLNVNEGLVAKGLATVYLVSKEKKPTNFKTLLQHQKSARIAKRGLWGNFQDYDVWVTKYGSAFHLADCRHIARSKGIKKIKASVGTDLGLHPCRTCLADK